MLFVPFEELQPRIGMALSTKVLEGVGCRDTPELRTDAVARTARQALQKSATKRVADAGRVDNFVRRNGRNLGVGRVRPTHR